MQALGGSPGEIDLGGLADLEKLVYELVAPVGAVDVVRDEEAFDRWPVAAVGDRDGDGDVLPFLRLQRSP